MDGIIILFALVSILSMLLLVGMQIFYSIRGMILRNRLDIFLPSRDDIHLLIKMKDHKGLVKVYINDEFYKSLKIKKMFNYKRDVFYSLKYFEDEILIHQHLNQIRLWGNNIWDFDVNLNGKHLGTYRSYVLGNAKRIDMD